MITIIAAIGKNRELGKDNQLIWRIKEDMQFFKDNTIGKPIVMGRKTFESLPNKLPNRKHIILTSKNIPLDDDIIVCHSLEEVLDWINEYNDEVMIIGGAKVYEEFLPFTDRLLLTEINDSDQEADVFFPEITNDWEKTIIQSNYDNNPPYQHVEYIKTK